jgi:glycosyltransferase involved in cell wall biosynthesis
MGHDVVFIDSGKNKHSWTPLKAKHIRPTIESQIPSADVVIATGYKSVGPTVKLPYRCGLKMHWIRAWETWQMNEEQIVERVLKRPTIKIVNALCLRKKLSEYGFESFIIRPGYDIDQFKTMNLRTGDVITLGGLYREGIHGKRKRTEWVLDAAKSIKNNHDNIRLFMFGSEANPATKLIDMYLRRPSIEEKVRFYNAIDIWLAPTKSEGLHMPPAEAMLTECCVVGTNAPLSGMQDYLFDELTGVVTNNRLVDFIRGTEKLIANPELIRRYGKAARERILQIGDRKQNMTKLIKLIERLK